MALTHDVEIAWVHHIPARIRHADWFWVVGILAVAFAVVAIFLDNMLFALVILLGGGGLLLSANHKAYSVEYEISHRGIRIGDKYHPLSHIEAFCIDREREDEYFLRFKSTHVFSPLITLPIPPEDADEIEHLLLGHVKEEHLEEPLVFKALEYFGF